MKAENAPFAVKVLVTDKSGVIFAESHIRYEDPNDAMRAYGHAVSGLHEFHRDERQERAALRKAAGLDPK